MPSTTARARPPPLSEASLLLTTYGTLRNDIASLADTKFHCSDPRRIPGDQKPPQSQSTQAVMALQAEFRIAMSGTPIENNLGELYSLFSLPQPRNVRFARGF
jgi:SNF2 family DNA or RNA helicase